MSDTHLLLYELAARAQRQAARRRRRRLAREGPGPATPRDEARLSPTQASGRQAEMRAAHWLAARGLRILAGNLRTRTGEIDLVADDQGVLVFVEVRARRAKSHGGAAASVNRAKQQRLIRAAHGLLPTLCERHYRRRRPACRFDVVAVDGQEVTWLKQAFSVP